MKELSKDYHDYVFREGKLVGEFEAMYRNSEEVPWHQDEQESWIDVRLTSEMLKDIKPYDEIHDLGCGLGHYLAIMKRCVGNERCRCVGYDISETACAKARQAWPDFDVFQLDLTVTAKPKSVIHDSQATIRRLFILRGILWYVFPKLDIVINTIRSLMTNGDALLVVQNFPPLDGEFIGKDVIPDHHALINHFSGNFSLARQIWYEDTLKTTNDNWFIGLFSVNY